MSALRYAAIIMIAGWSGGAVAQTTPAPGAAGSARPARGPEQSSTPSAAPAASTTRPTAAVNPEPGVQKMNDEAKQRVEREGK